jgi:propanol-preferring alcohol dehydrogenase
MPYELLWYERRLCSVANVTRQDGRELLALGADSPLETEVEAHPLEEANLALSRLREGRVSGAALLRI